MKCSGECPTLGPSHCQCMSLHSILTKRLVAVFLGKYCITDVCYLLMVIASSTYS